MKCWYCNTELIWGNDFDIDEENDHFCMETNLSCPECDCLVIVYVPKEKNEDE